MSNVDGDIYSLDPDDEDFSLNTLTICWTKAGTPWTKKTRVPFRDLYKQYDLQKDKRIKHESYAFCLSALIISVAAKPHRKLLSRITLKKSRNIKIAAKTTSMFLKEAQDRIMQLNDEKPLSNTKKHMNALEEHIENAFESVKKELQFSTINEDYTYKITDEIVAKANGDGCIKYLKGVQGNEYIFSESLKKICDKLKRDFSDDFQPVMQALEKTKSRDHISAFSMNTEDNQIFISIANEKGEYVKMEDWKFISLVERFGTALRLHLFRETKYNEQRDKFEFCSYDKGRVVGKFFSKDGYLYIASFDDQDQPIARSVFFVDCTYLLCLYTVLKRLNKDKERFSEYYNLARTVISENADIFDILPCPID